MRASRASASTAPSTWRPRISPRSSTACTGDFYVFQEVIDQSSSERVRDWEYAPDGDVTEFAYAFALGAAFDDACGGSLSDLENAVLAS